MPQKVIVLHNLYISTLKYIKDLQFHGRFLLENIGILNVNGMFRSITHICSHVR